MSGAAGDAASAMAPTPVGYLWPRKQPKGDVHRSDVLENSQQAPKRVRDEARSWTSYYDNKVCVLECRSFGRAVSTPTPASLHRARDHCRWQKSNHRHRGSRGYAIADGNGNPENDDGQADADFNER
jgi:hypothetical protein